MQLKLSRELLLVLLSVFIQVPLAFFLGHYYDDRIFMATGYLVGTGFNPYLPHNFAGVFPSAIISGTLPVIGYPAIWPLWLGLVYRLTYGLTQNIFLYNFATKLPLIAAQVGLAYLVKNILLNFQVTRKKVQMAFFFILFNPFIMLTSVAWGEFDILVVCLSLAYLYLLSKGKILECAVCLGFAVALKPIALPLAPMPLFYSAPNITNRKRLIYSIIFISTLAAFYFGPFLVAKWRIPLSPSQLTDQLQMAGGLTLFNITELFQAQAILPKAFGFMGYLWIPALIIGYFAVFNDRPCDFSCLIKKTILVMFLFFLSRTWVSEPNVNLLLPLMLLAASFGELRFRDFHYSWAIPLVFMLPNYAFPQLLFPVYPTVTTSLQAFSVQFGVERLLARFLVAAIWEIFALKTIFGIWNSRNHIDYGRKQFDSKL